MQRGTWAVVAAAALACLTTGSQAAPLAAPNVVEISPRLVTAGQPSAEALAGLKAQGYEAVVYLAPPTVGDAVRNEPTIVTGQGLVFINIPIRFDQPTEADYDRFAAAMAGLGGRKVLVHCQINMRASAMVFLYRAIALKEPPRAAYESVSRVWSPDGPWRRLMDGLLRKHGVAFEIF